MDMNIRKSIISFAFDMKITADVQIAHRQLFGIHAEPQLKSRDIPFPKYEPVYHKRLHMSIGAFVDVYLNQVYNADIGLCLPGS